MTTYKSDQAVDYTDKASWANEDNYNSYMQNKGSAFERLRKRAPSDVILGATDDNFVTPAKDNEFESDLASLPPPDFSGNARNMMNSNLSNLAGVGPAGKIAKQIAGQPKSAMARTMLDNVKRAMGDDGQPLPQGPGQAYGSHLFGRAYGQAVAYMNQNKTKPNAALKDLISDNEDAMKTAINTLGVLSDRNPHGCPVGIESAMALMSGGRELPPVEQAELRTRLEGGNTNFDPKKSRKFVNYDGSLTWELLNDDKTVMSRFTMGEYKGKKLFAQGGHTKFSDLLKQAMQRLGKDVEGQFDAIREKYR